MKKHLDFAMFVSKNGEKKTPGRYYSKTGRKPLQDHSRPLAGVPKMPVFLYEAVQRQHKGGALSFGFQLGET